MMMGQSELVFKREHLKVRQLIDREETRSYKSKYLFKNNIPEYPRPEFCVSHLKHDTNKDGLTGIRRDSGFRNPNRDSLLWWSLTVTPEEISSAEQRLLEKTFPDRTEEQIQQQQSFLEKFLTSPSFDGTSRLGSYRFTFTVKELLKAYSDQFCSGKEPVIRTFKTVLYKQELMYAVLVHSPENQIYSNFPLLTNDPNAVCRYSDGCFIWKPEAMSETHRYELIQNDSVKQLETVPDQWRQFYVWDHIAIVLDVDQQVLRFDPDRLRENLAFCKQGYPTIIDRSEFQDYQAAADFVQELWPDSASPLRR